MNKIPYEQLKVGDKIRLTNTSDNPTPYVFEGVLKTNENGLYVEGEKNFFYFLDFEAYRNMWDEVVILP